jgi:hypothetical protein
MRTVGRNRNRTCFLAVCHTARLAQCQARLIESIELFEDQHGQRLAEIERRVPDRTEQIAFVERRDTNAGVRDVRSRYHARRFERAVQSREVDAGEDMRRVGRADQQGVRRIRRPAGKVRCAKIGGVEFRAGHLSRAVDAPAAGRGRRIPALPAGQRLTRVERRAAGKCHTRKTQRDAA